jgi:hypothetical protein
MTWIKGEIVAFPGTRPEHQELRKIRTEPGQKPDDMFFFRLEWARRKGYPDSELAVGKTIEFEPEAGSDRPRVGQFKQYSGDASAGARGAVGGHVAAGARKTAVPSEGGRENAGAAASRGEGGDASPFLNPYHFIPLVAPTEPSLSAADDLLREGTLHDRFLLPGAGDGGDLHYSGRVVCRLETEGPMVVGAEQRKPHADSPTEVHPFELPRAGATPGAVEMRPAIPGSSLRGLVSAIVEAASCSALRVLPEREFTRRVAIDQREALSEIGMVEKHNGRLKIRPLSRSVQDMTSEANRRFAGTLRNGPARPADRWRCLVDGYVRSASGLGREPRPSSFLAMNRPASWSASHREFWYADLAGARFHWSRGFCTGLDLAAPPLREAEWRRLAEPESRRYTRGILLVLGLDGSKARNLPQTKKHEYFLPWEDAGKEPELLDLPAEVVAELCGLAEDASELPRGGESNDLPYLHAGRERPQASGDKTRWAPRAGDLVYFERGKTGSVCRLSWSAAWRRRIPGSLHESIAHLHHVDLVPFHSGRAHITLAERLFGFVEADGQRALAGRLRFSHALVAGESVEGDWYLPRATLEILAAPKPPSPAFYFGQRRYIAKRDLDLKGHAPQGRKVYLHHREQDVEACRYESREDEASPEARRKAKLKMSVTPLRRGVAFYFHVDFQNLSGEELGHLLYALRPTAEFRHKLGLGKPLGLGRVRIDPVALCFIDRDACYRPAGCWAAKYAGRGLEADSDERREWAALTGDLAERYRHEREVSTLPAIAGGSWPRLAELSARVRDEIPPTVRWAVELVGDPASAEHTRVTYPVTVNAAKAGEHFHWFVNNDRGDRRHLKAIEKDQPLPTLMPNRERPR